MVALIIRDSTNTARTITELIIRDATNTPRTITEIWVRDINNNPRLVYNPSGSATLDVDASPPEVIGTTFDGSGTASTEAVTASASGGTAPYTYAWTVVSYTAVSTPTADSPASAVTSFTQTGMATPGYSTAVFRCTATDANTTTATVDVPVSFYSYELGP